MAITEVYKKPTVTSVIFQIVFPTFFSMESKIGDYQLKIMERFPKSTLLIQNQVVFSQSATIEGKINMPSNEHMPGTKKIWQFKTDDESVTLNITADTLDISSSKHKTYNNANSDSKFRDTIEFVVSNFLKIIPLFSINRIGLRYLDDCPLPENLSNNSFLEYYNSSINFLKIDDVNNSATLLFYSNTIIDGVTVQYKEQLSKIDNKYEYKLDFDGQNANIISSNYLAITDHIHDVIVKQFEDAIKEPVLKIMKDE